MKLWKMRNHFPFLNMNNLKCVFVTALICFPSFASWTSAKEPTPEVDEKWVVEKVTNTSEKPLVFAAKSLNEKFFYCRKIDGNEINVIQKSHVYPSGKIDVKFIFDDIQNLAYSFSKDQLSLLKMKNLKAKDLNDSQIRLLKNLFKKRGEEKEFSQFLLNGQIEISIFNASVNLSVRGISVDKEDLKNGSLLKNIEKSDVYFLPNRTERIKKSLLLLAEKSEVEIDKVTVVSLRNWASRIGYNKIEFTSDLGEQLVGVSPGRFSADILFSSMLLAADAEIRTIANTVVVAPYALPFEINQDAEFVSEGIAFWDALERVFEIAANNPQSDFGPFAKSQVMALRLINYDELSKSQQDYVLEKKSLTLSDILSLRDRLECQIVPVLLIEVNYQNKTNTKRSFGSGFGPPYYYKWWSLRSRECQ